MGAVSKRTADAPNRPAKRLKLEVQQTLYIQNLNDKINRALLKHSLFMIFSTYGEVLEINMKMKGQAHIVLDSCESASHALRSLQATNILGKAIHIDYAKKKSVSIEAAEKAIAEE
ncbi:hypothetical protein METBIDRAFT_9622 [Metschnikowia bicuspidata var. bicuspidata NRRL YB-4993]|uniref:RRM domain-containing protein n=1 Tax=Metschnikowia bicuspidata var. bicuspidata NRRL YB-4993 TaxID=869754 RepID=A0A1A0HH75_9ASCO|nr:hypothetical protein METBIDRAFT_9622 [Metschnikowia bicuspidata var. bicuspidata NRRL YB-4993]OBA23350.1 hypothetical protein METBIDRAFT_9622 [Metschnikowia bicuspidata var. bicuspidata NRRL YB-4993]